MSYPPPESKGGWPVITEPDAIRAEGRMDPDRLARAWVYSLNSKAEPTDLYPPQFILPEVESSGVVIVRHGAIVGEWYHNGDRHTRWNVRSCSKSFTGTAFGLLFQDSRDGKLDRTIGLDSPAYSFIPEGYPLSDPRKEKIALRHLLSMSSNIKGEDNGIFGLYPADGSGAFEQALGRCPSKDGKSAAEMTGTPGTTWEYSDPAFAHLSLVFAHAAGRNLEEYLRERVFDPIGIEHLSWDTIGGKGHIGPHTNPFSTVQTTARDLARFGYLMLAEGLWEGDRIVPGWWVEQSVRPTQTLNESYGYTWWLNTHGALWPDVPADAFAAMGSAANKCYVMPSLDIVAVRIGRGPWPWNDAPFVQMVAAAAL